MSEMTRWEPQREPTSLREAIDRLFEDSFVRPGLFGGAGRAGAMVPLDVFETGDKVVVKVSAPGLKPEDIEVTITGDLLTVKGEFKSDESVEKRNYLLHERHYGSFCRQVGLPAGVSADKASATFENGILTLEMPKVESSKSKSIKVIAK